MHVRGRTEKKIEIPSKRCNRLYNRNSCYINLKRTMLSVTRVLPVLSIFAPSNCAINNDNATLHSQHVLAAFRNRVRNPLAIHVPMPTMSDSSKTTMAPVTITRRQFPVLKLNEETHRLTLLFSVRPRVRTRITHAYIKARVEVERDTLEAPSIYVYVLASIIPKY